jgi:hypothetical protein
MIRISTRAGLRFTRCLLLVLLALAFESGCSAWTGSEVAPSTVVRQVATSQHESRLYVSVNYVTGSFIGIYDPSSEPLQLIGEITSLEEPWNLTVDRAGTLYAVDRKANVVYTFRKGSTTPSRKFVQPSGQTVNSVAIGADGTMYVADFVRSTSVTVEVYPKGSKKPKRTLTVGNVGSIPIPVVGVDTNNNVYVTYESYGSSSYPLVAVSEFPAGSTQPKTIAITSAVSNWSGQATFDRKGDLLLGSVINGSSREIGVFPPGQSTPSYLLNNGNPYYCLAVGMSYDQKRVYSTAGPDVAITSYPKGKLLYTQAQLLQGSYSYVAIKGFAASL